MKAAIYSRVSTENQDYKRQTEDLKEYAKRQNYEIVRIFEEKESGFNDDRPQFSELRKLTKEDIDIVLVYELPRLSRRSIHLQSIVEEFTQKKIDIFALKEGWHTLRTDGSVDPTTQIIIAVIATMAQQEAETFKARTKSGRDHKVIHEGHFPTGTGPYGYKHNPETMMIEIDENERPIVERAFELCIKGKALVDIALTLEAEGYKTRGGGRWQRTSIKSILNNETCTGHFDYKGHKIPCPQIISEEMFEQAQVSLDSRRTRSAGRARYDFLLRKLIVCPYCGLRYTHRNDSNSYACSTRSLSRLYGHCKGKQISTANLDFMVWKIILLAHKDLLTEQYQEKMIDPIQQEIAEINKTISDINTIINRRERECSAVLELAINAKMEHPEIPAMFQKAYEKYERINKEIHEYRERIAPFERKKQTLENKIEAIRANSEINITDSIEKKDIIHKMVEKIVPYNYDKHAVIVVHFKSGLQYNIIYEINGRATRYCIINNDHLQFNFPYEKQRDEGVSVLDFTVPRPLEGIFDDSNVGNWEAGVVFVWLKSKGLLLKMPKFNQSE